MTMHRPFSSRGLRFYRLRCIYKAGRAKGFPAYVAFSKARHETR